MSRMASEAPRHSLASEMIGDMKQVVVYLSQAKTGVLPTQQVEEDVIAALEEMIEALKKAQRDLKDVHTLGDLAALLRDRRAETAGR